MRLSCRNSEALTKVKTEKLIIKNKLNYKEKVYTEFDINNIINYANLNGVRVIPEVDFTFEQILI